MHSCVRFIDHDNNVVRRITLVYPDEKDSWRDRIVIITLVGGAFVDLLACGSLNGLANLGRTDEAPVGTRHPLSAGSERLRRYPLRTDRHPAQSRISMAAI